jgi:hypothetical protein
MAGESITSLFERLRVPLRNARWSWGAQNGNTIVLRTWGDEYDSSRKTIRILRDRASRDMSDSPGLNERISHLRALWSGNIAGYTVMANAQNPTRSPRVIKDFREDGVFPLLRMFAEADGTIAAELGPLVPIHQFKKHAEAHRTSPGEGAFPG